MPADLARSYPGPVPVTEDPTGSAAADRPATPADVDDICSQLPGTWFGTSWGDVPTWLVPHRVGDPAGRGRGFVLYRKPHKTAVDPATGEPYEDLVVVKLGDPADKVALVEAEGPFFTVDHFRSHPAVLVRLSRLHEITVAELREVITDAWAANAPRSLVREHLR
ncbi:MAG: hypothetical protein JWR42_2267 [Marmoricola sp.]|nr:hypothetical protein [Marmoricola sp.]